MRTQTPVLKLAVRLVRHRPLLFTGDLLVGVMFFLLGLVPGLIFRRYFDQLSAASAGEARASSVYVPLALLVLVKVAHVLFGASWMALDTLFRFGVSARLRRVLTVMSLRSTEQSEVSQGDFLTRYRDDATEVAEYLGKRGLLNLTSCLGFSVASLVILFTINATVTATAVLPTLVLTIGTSLAGRRLQAFHRESRAASADAVSVLRDGFACVQALKIGLAERAFVDRYVAASDRRRRADLRESAYQAVIQSSSGVVVAIGTGLIMVMSSAQFRAGAFTLGDLALFLYCLVDVGAGVAVVGMYVGKTRQVRIAISRLDEVVQHAGGSGVLDELDTQLPLGADDETGAVLPPLERLDVCNVSYRHAGDRLTLDDVSLTVHRGGLVVVCGHTSAGKSTLLEVIAGLRSPSRGEVRWNGTPLHRADGLPIATGIAYLPQAPKLFNGTLRDNIAFGLEVGDDEVVRAAEVFLLGEELDAWPDGLHTVVGSGGRAVSGGQLLRIAGARMLLRPADLWIIDDMSSGLDATTEEKLWCSLRAATDAALIVVSNRPAITESADVLLELTRGRLAQLS
jgi:ATP-binding cassette subfamily B protein